MPCAAKLQGQQGRSRMDAVACRRHCRGDQRIPWGSWCSIGRSLRAHGSRQVSHTDHTWGPWSSLGLTFLGFGAQADLNRASHNQPRGSDVGCAAPSELCSHAHRRRHVWPLRLPAPAIAELRSHAQRRRGVWQIRGNVLKLPIKARLGEQSTECVGKVVVVGGNTRPVAP